MHVAPLAIDAVKLVRPPRHADPRGYLVETWNRETFAAAGITVDFVQDNSTYSARAGTIRGIHYQRPPRAQAKLVRVVRGAIFDVALDLRRNSATYGRHVAVTLTAESGEQIFIPVGFAHGFCTLQPDTEIAYKLSDFHSPEHDAGILWNDPALGIEWPLGGLTPTMSEKDRAHPLLAESTTGF